ncbi:hypothetical protein L596_013125 [Steinernema carpocapsae]|uniref:Uncharacterized protein n=1 Tax=Steinernema carpocapsae TaxID=34508 RepID=A0A4U5NZA2_STECR|nr:hypothetical protein L596_013125 [Steinernema carpocapsae]
MTTLSALPMEIREASLQTAGTTIGPNTTIAKRRIMTQHGKRAYLIYRPSKTEEEYKKHKANVQKFKNHMTKHGSKIEFSSSYRKDFENIINDAASAYEFPMVLMMSVFYDYGDRFDNGYAIPTDMSYAGVYWPTNGNSNAMEKFSFDGAQCHWFIWKIGCDTRKNHFNFFLGL